MEGLRSEGAREKGVEVLGKEEERWEKEGRWISWEGRVRRRVMAEGKKKERNRREVEAWSIWVEEEGRGRKRKRERGKKISDGGKIRRGMVEE